MLEETLQIAHGMWEGERGSGGGVQRPAVPGRAPAQLPAVAVTPQGPDHDRRRRREEDPAPRGPVRRRDCNVFGSPEGIARKYAILAEHCAAVGRDPDEIERSTLQNVSISRRRPAADRDAGAGRRPLRRAVRRRRRARHHRHARTPRPGRARARRPRRHPAAPRPAVTPATGYPQGVSNPCYDDAHDDRSRPTATTIDPRSNPFGGFSDLDRRRRRDAPPTAHRRPDRPFAAARAGSMPRSSSSAPARPA